MISDSNRKAAEEFREQCKIDATMKALDPITWHRKVSERVGRYDGFLAGRSSALKELEQVAREAFEAGRYGKYTRNSIMPRPLLWSEVQHDFDYKEFEDYWQQKTESKEAND